MRNELSGRVTGTSFQIGDVHGDIVLLGDSTPTSPRPRVRPQPSGSGTKLTVGYVVIGVICVLITITRSCDSDPADTGFPASDRGTRPAGVSDAMVTQVVWQKLQSCATEVVAEPANCPQAHNVTGAENVRWHHAGDPTDGMLIRWDHDRFVVLGAAVMTIDFDKGVNRYSEVKTFHFETEVQWRGADTQIDIIRQPKLVPAPGTIEKQRYNLPDTDLVGAVRQGFVTCASATFTPMPRTCPRYATPRAAKATWSIDGNPVGNCRTSRNTEFGLLRVTGSYSLVVRWIDTSFWDTNKSRTQSGTYEALLVRTTDGKAELLAIRHVP